MIEYFHAFSYGRFHTSHIHWSNNIGWWVPNYLVHNPPIWQAHRRRGCLPYQNPTARSKKIWSRVSLIKSNHFASVNKFYQDSISLGISNGDSCQSSRMEAQSGIYCFCIWHYKTVRTSPRRHNGIIISIFSIILPTRDTPRRRLSSASPTWYQRRLHGTRSLVCTRPNLPVLESIQALYQATHLPAQNRFGPLGDYRTNRQLHAARHPTSVHSTAVSDIIEWW